MSGVTKMFIKADKLGRICAITNSPKSHETPAEYKPALNMYRGRQLKKYLRECIDYTKLSEKTVLPANFKELSPEEQKNVLTAKSEAQKELDHIHYVWNN